MIPSSENQVIYQGNGETTVFDYAFKIIDSTDIHLIRVSADGAEAEVKTDFYVDMEASKVYYPGYAPGAEEPEQDRPPVLQPGEKLIVYRDVPITQLASMPKQWPFDVNEDMHDKSCIIDQQLKGEVDRSLKVSRVLDGKFDATFPVAPGKTIRFNEDGTAFEVTEDPANVIPIAENLKNETADIKRAAENSLIVIGDQKIEAMDAIKGEAETAAANAQKAANVAVGAKNKIISEGFNFAFENVAEMRASTYLAEGMIAKTAGYWSHNDGGGALYYIRQAKTDGTEDETKPSAIHLINGLIAELIVDDFVTPQMFGAVGDGVTDDTQAIINAVSYAIVNNISNVIFKKTNYVVSSIIYIPYDMNVDGNYATIIIKGDIYAFGLNTKDAVRWETAYPTKIGCEFKNFIFRNYNADIYKNANAISLACGMTIKNIEAYSINFIIKQTPNYYIDNKEIRRIVSRTHIGEYDVEFGLGDGLKISDCMDVDFLIGGCAGANIENCINGSFYITDSKAINISAWHNELTHLKGNVTKNSYVCFNNCVFFLKNDVSPLFSVEQNNNNNGSHCVFENCTFNLKPDFIKDFTSAITDIKVSTTSTVVLKNSYRVYAYPSGYGGGAGSLIINDVEIHPVRCNNQIICDSGNFQNDDTVYCVTKTDFKGLINNVTIREDASFLTTTGTYYYAGIMLLDKVRLIGVRRYQASPNEKSITVTSSTLHPYIEYYADWSMRQIPCGYFRFYKGTSSGVYDKYLDIPVNAAHCKITFTDNNINYYNCLWKNRAASQADATINTNNYKLKANGNVEITADSIPLYGSWTKGDLIINSSPSAGAYVGWICTASGTPGTWKGFGLIQS